MKGFTLVLKKGVPFHWDHIAQKAIDALKSVLARAYFIPLTINEIISSI